MPAATESTGVSPSLFSSLRTFWTVILSILHTRLDLATTELEEEAVRATKLITAGLISLICLASAFFFAMFFIIALAWDTAYRLPVIGLIFAVYFLAGMSLLLIARGMIQNRPKFLSQTLAELQRDVDGLRQANAAAKPEPKP